MDFACADSAAVTCDISHTEIGSPTTDWPLGAAAPVGAWACGWAGGCAPAPEMSTRSTAVRIVCFERFIVLLARLNLDTEAFQNQVVGIVHCVLEVGDGLHRTCRIATLDY